MPELILEIGGRVYEVACQEGEEKSLETAAALLDAEASQIADTAAAATEKRMLLLAGLMLADGMTALKRELAAAEERIRAAEERVRIAEAKSAMLAANALKAENAANRPLLDEDAEQLRAENEMAVELLSRVLEDINALADAVEAGRA